MALMCGRAGRANRPPDVLVAVLALMPREQVERLVQAGMDALDLGHDRDPDSEPEPMEDLAEVSTVSPFDQPGRISRRRRLASRRSSPAAVGA